MQRQPLLPLQKAIACSTGEHKGGTAGTAEQQIGAERQKVLQRPLLPLQKAIERSRREHEGATAAVAVGNKKLLKGGAAGAWC